MDVEEFIKKINEERRYFGFATNISHYLLMLYEDSHELSLVKSSLRSDIKELCIENPKKMLIYFKDFLSKNYPQHMHLLTNYNLNYYDNQLEGIIKL